MFTIKDKLFMHSGNGGTNGGGMMSNVCYTYDKPTDPTKLENIVANPDVTFNREVYMGGSMTMDDGIAVTIWGFNDNTSGGGGMMGGGMNASGPFPSPAMRVTQGQLVHTNLSVNMMLKHTIHHHGIEPDFRSDGVGHTSWDVSGTHTYQWRPSSAGTYFYHCHTNTVLHAEMGMYGALIVDPPVNPNDPVGTKRAFAGGPVYDVEAIWVVDEIDPAWHTLDWTAGLCGADVGLNELNPYYFIITGVDATSTRNGTLVSTTPSASIASSGIPVTMNSNQTLLIRYINAGYMPQKLRVPMALNAKIIASDGHPFRNANGSPRPDPIAAGGLETVSAERYDILVENPAIGDYTIEFDVIDWMSGDVLGVAKTKITVV